MSANFEIIINRILTGTFNGLDNVIKKVEFTVKGTEEGQVFELSQIVDLTEPEAESFKPLSEVTQDDVTSWIIENFEDMPNVELHIQYVLTKEVEKSKLDTTPLPWEPIPEPVEPIDSMKP